MLPSDAERVRAWAVRRGLSCEPLPRGTWFEAWEPYDTMIAPRRYVNACTRALGSGHVVLVEPWFADDGDEPLDRAVLAFATCEALRYRASMRVGEWFLTRVAFVASAAPTQVRLGDAVWDERSRVYASSEQVGGAAFHRQLRSFLACWRFQGHLELRPGGLVVHVAGLRAQAADLDQLADFVPQLVANAVAYAT